MDDWQCARCDVIFHPRFGQHMPDACPRCGGPLTNWTQMLRETCDGRMMIAYGHEVCVSAATLVEKDDS